MSVRKALVGALPFGGEAATNAVSCTVVDGEQLSPGHTTRVVARRIPKLTFRFHFAMLNHFDSVEPAYIIADLMNEVKEDDCYIPTMVAEEIAAEHLLPGPKIDNAGALYFDENFDKGLEIDDISSIFHYGLKSNSGGLDSNTSGEGKDELKCGGFDAILHEDEVADLRPTIGLTTACEDYYLDVDFSQKVPELDYHFCEESDSRNSGSESHSPGTSNEAVREPESYIRGPDSPNDYYEMTIPCESHWSLGSTCGSEMLVKDKMGQKGLATCDLKDNVEAKPVAGLLSSGKPHKSEKKINLCHGLNPERVAWTSARGKFDISASLVGETVDGDDLSMQKVFTDISYEVRKVGPLLRQKRLRKPTRRYIEESSQLKSQYHRVRKDNSTSSSKGKLLGVRHRNKHQHKGAKAALLISREVSPGRSPRPVPFQEQDSSMKFAGIVGHDSDEEYNPVGCNYSMRTKRGSDRRKQNMVWTLSEVMKLVDGISQFGVGKWTAIRKTFFSSSSYRTSLDIRDKWRNLLRASCMQLKSKDEDERTWRNGSQPLPKALLQRVSELASIHPYPRCGSKLSRTSRRDLSVPLSCCDNPF
ncbi:hypothetical protein Nepgr_011652 [Nepenthes gracilis]|uniref:Uncharacterized protein n=1 Tax=Nepenthes gracilis TaxID=150966 RepID=A0AAD3XMK2_NEPGR|nr:hypothetical protein Nepgr_011652 [Nepenthes gracilis]